MFTAEGDGVQRLLVSSMLSSIQVSHMMHISGSSTMMATADITLRVSPAIHIVAGIITVTICQAA